MDNINTLLTGFLLTSAVLTFFTSIYLLTSKKTALAKTFSALCLCVTFYSFGYALELHSVEMSHMLFWNLVQYAGIPFLPAFWLILAIQYRSLNKFLGRISKLLIFLIPVVTLVLRYTNDMHHMYYTYVRLVSNQLFPVLYIEKGPWYLVQSIYITFAFLFSSSLYLQKMIRHRGIIRKQCFLMLLASILPWFSLLSDLFNIAPYGIDYTPFMLSFSFVLFLLVLFRYNFLDLKPMARDKVFESSDNGIIVLDPQHNIIDFNSRAAEIIPGLTTGSLSMNARNFLKNENLLNAITEPVDKPIEVKFDEIQSYYNISNSKITDRRSNLLGYTITLTDVTKYVETMKKLDFIASRDDLTGLYNRRFFVDRSNYELDRARRYKHALSIIMLDLDHFKNINDEYGHQGGDIVLKAVADVCTHSLRSIDLLGRLGGEEFFICLPETEPQGAIMTAERIRTDIEDMEISYEGHKMKVTASIGITGTDCVKEENLDSFLRSADRALYAAKADGRNCVRSELLRMIS